MLKRFLLLALAGSLPVHAQFSSLETKDLRVIYYGQSYVYLVQHITRCSENALQFHKNLFHYRPGEKITVLLHDFNDYGNAGADALPRDHVTLSIAPNNYVYETVPANERMNSTMNHEFVHIVSTDAISRPDSFFRSIFLGKVSTTSEQPVTILYSYLTNPRRYAPRWYHEGIAVFMETWMAGGLGRALGAYDEMAFRTMVLDSSTIYDMVGLESEGTKVDFQVGVNSYLYGTRFVSYLAYQYGPESLIRWITRTDSSAGYFAADFKRVYGLPLDRAWLEWIQWERQFQKSNLDSIRQYPVTASRNISGRALGSVSRAYYDSSLHRIFVGVNYPGQVPHLAALDRTDGRMEKICDVKGATLYSVTSLAYDDSGSTLFYTTDNNDWRDLNSVDVESGRSRLLIKDVRVGDLAFNKTDRALWGIRHYNGISTLVRIPYPYSEWNQIYSWPYGKDMYDIDISSDGKYLSGALAEISGKQTLILMEISKLIADTASYETLFDFETSLPANFIFSPDGRYLYGSSYYSGVSNIFRYEFGTKKMEALTNSETGIFRPVPVPGDSLLVFRYTATGFVPVLIADKAVENVSAINFLGQKIVEKYPVVKKWQVGSPALIKIDSLTTYSGDYSALKNIRLASAYPVVEGYKNFKAYGARLNFSDPVGLYNLDITASFTPNSVLDQKERWHLTADYSYLNWKSTFKYNGADFYDLFGPTKTSRKGYSLGISYRKPLLFDDPKSMDYTVGVTGYGGLEQLPDFQNVGATFNKFISANAGFNYKYLRSSLGAVDFEKGYKWQIVTSGNYVNSKMFPRLYSNFDFGFPLPVDHSSIWLRSSAGKSFGPRSNPFANFYFGGFGNNWVDHATETQYREYYSFPGVELNSIPGTAYGKLLAEWLLPPVRFRHLGTPSFYLTWARLSVFSTGIVTNGDGLTGRKTLYNIGSQLDFRVIMLSYLKLTFSVGYAQAFERSQPVSNQWMFSLKVL